MVAKIIFYIVNYFFTDGWCHDHILIITAVVVNNDHNEVVPKYLRPGLAKGILAMLLASMALVDFDEQPADTYSRI